MKQKIGFLFANFNVGGAERLTNRVIQLLNKDRFEPILLTLYEAGSIGENLMNEGYRVITNLSMGKFDPFVGIRLKNIINELEIPLIVTTDSPAPLFWISKLREKSNNFKLVVELHSTLNPNTIRINKLAFNASMKVTDCYTALAPSHRDFFVSSTGLDSERISVIFSGIDIERFQPPKNKEIEKSNLGFPPDKTCVGIIARLRPEKNHEFFLSAAEKISKERNDIHFFIVGSGSEQAKLEAYTKENNLESIVSFLGNREDMPDIYRALDLIVLCSKAVEALPVNVMEASSTAIPSISTKIGSVGDLIDDGETGYLVEQGDLDTFVKKITLLADNKELRLEMGLKARAKAISKFSEMNMVNDYETCFDSMLNNKLR